MQHKIFNSNQLKFIAIVAMTLDHISWLLFPGYSTYPLAVIFHIIGRITAPIMWFFISEGYHHTRNVKKYLMRLFILAFVSHFSYNFFFGISFIPLRDSVLNQTSVIWPLAWGLVILCINDSKHFKEWQKMLLTILICIISFPADWSCIPVIAILFMHEERGNLKKQMIWMMLCCFAYAIVYFVFVDKLYGVIQLFTCLSIPLLARYNGEKGKGKHVGRIFYIYYPLHLVMLGVLKLIIF